MGNFFNPFMFFSMTISIMMICLTIYFITNAEVAVTVSPDSPLIVKMSTYFFPFWAGLQILAAIIYILSIFITGMKTNEEASLGISASNEFF